MNSPLLRAPVLRTALAAASCLLLASCASVPTTGPVVPSDGGDSSADPYGQYVRLLPAGPQTGVAPEGLISDFLKDMGSFEEDHKAARSYMLPETQQEWRTGGSVMVFDNLNTVDLEAEVSGDGLTATVRMRSPLVATIDENGKYVPSRAGVLLDETFVLARENGDPEGEWRIRSLPDELILSRLDVERTYRPFNLYYYNAEDSALVPDPVYLPVSTDQLAERLLQQLVEGPTDWLAPSVGTEFAEGVPTSVEVDEERAVVSVGRAGGDEFRMGAQIAWTLRQLPEVQDFTLRVNGSEVAFAGAEGQSPERPRPASNFWQSVGPGAVSQDVHAYYTHEGQLWSASDWDSDVIGEPERVPGPLGAGDVQLERFAVSVDERTVAGITLGGGTVVTSRTSPGSQVVEVLDDGVFSELSWDAGGNLWVVEEVPENGEEEPEEEPGGEAAEAGTTELWILRGGEQVVRVDVPGLRNESLVHFRVSRDGARAAVVTEVDGRRSLKLGRVVHDADGQVSVEGFITLAQELENVTDIAWRSADQLAVLGSREGGTPQAFLVPLDGGTPPASVGNSVTGMVSLSGAPGQPLVVGTDEGSIWISNDRMNWQNVTEGSSPTFPG